MRTADIQAGLRVLAGRPTRPKNLRLGTVIKTGVTHSYYATAGYTSYGGYSTRHNGVLVELDRPHSSEPDGTVFRPEHVQPAVGPVFDNWMRIEVRRAEDEAAEERQRQADQELIDAFAAHQVEVGVANAGQLTMTRQTAGRLLGVLDSLAEKLVPAPTRHPQWVRPEPTEQADGSLYRQLTVGGAHSHALGGQSLRHAHADGAAPHGYFGHPEDPAAR